MLYKYNGGPKLIHIKRAENLIIVSFSIDMK